MRPNIRDVGDPCPIRHIDGELAIQCVVYSDRRLATILAGLLPVADLRLDACKPAQAGNTVLRNGFTHVDQIIMDFALLGDCKQSPVRQWITIDLATGLPRALDQCGLAFIFLRTLA